MWVTLIAALTLFAAVPQTPPRDAARSGAGTAAVSGRVVDQETGAGIPRATVVLVRMSGANAPERRYARSGDDGRFEFGELPAGAYHLGADTGDERPTHLPELADAAGPSRRPAPSARRTIDVKDGQIVNDVVVALSRALAVAGVVVNDYGEPLANMEVRAELIRGSRVVRRSPVRRTDDRGEFRLFGLPAGRYRVCALSPPPYLRTPLFPERLVTTCHPSASREQDGALVVLGRGDEPLVQIRMQRSPLVSLTGTVLRASGAPAAGAAVRVSTRNRLDVYGMTFRTDASGRFSVTDLIPGEYDLEASAPDPNQPEIQRAEFATATAVVGGGDADVVLAMSRTARVAGHVSFEGAPAPAPADRRDLAIVASGPPLTPRADVARVQPDLTFVLDQLVGPQLLDAVGAPDGWVVKSVRYAGAELTDTPAEFRPSADPRHLEVTLTRRAAALSGRIVDGAGSPRPHARVFLLPAERQRWARVASEAMRVSDETGAFAFESRRPGEYFAVAVSEEDAPDLPEPEDLELLARLAERVTLLEGERRSVTLRLVSVPEER